MNKVFLIYLAIGSCKDSHFPRIFERQSYLLYLPLYTSPSALFTHLLDEDKVIMLINSLGDSVFLAGAVKC
ncbi:hypothetical protein IB75_10690 [Nitrosococcus oceani C-27]|uniref:Uncharacterized protein n=1 Tax=Nitrosococcus oceani C-27 TaxID=314279 RepID=A0A0E2Z0A8_9GAMM|nr:hypothetical protein IB75_10690 [Nitrosococcus oceani C-27]